MSTTSTTGAPCGGTVAPPPHVTHVVWIWMENHTASQVIGSAAAPYVTRLTGQCATAASYASVGAPSEPNYIGATSGGTWGIHDDNPPSSHPLTVDNLFRQVRAAGGTARSYEESMPANCALGSSGRYAVKHNPAAYYVGADDRAACGRDDVPMGDASGGRFVADLAAGLPTFAFVTPNLCDDTHDCSVAAGDRWLAAWVPRILTGPDYRAGTTAVFVMWDEPTPMPFVAVAPSVRPGTVVPGRIDHYAMLRTTEAVLGVPLLGGAATATDLRGPLNL